LTWISSSDNPPSLRSLYLKIHSRRFIFTISESLWTLPFLERIFLSSPHASIFVDRDGMSRAFKQRDDIGSIMLLPAGARADLFVDLSQNKCLRSVHFGVVRRGNNAQWAAQTLASIDSAQMEELILDVWLYDEWYEEFKWEEVDAVLQLRQFSKLQTFQIRVVIPYEHRESFAEYAGQFAPGRIFFSLRLPRCHARGILSMPVFAFHGDEVVPTYLSHR
jgi:hypothetical protein